MLGPGRHNAAPSRAEMDGPVPELDGEVARPADHGLGCGGMAIPASLSTARHPHEPHRDAAETARALRLAGRGEAGELGREVELSLRHGVPRDVSVRSGENAARERAGPASPEPGRGVSARGSRAWGHGTSRTKRIDLVMLFFGLSYLR